MVAWLLKCNISRLFFMNFKNIFKTMRNAYFLCSKQTFYIIRMPISYSRSWTLLYSSIHHYLIFMATKVNRSTKSDFFYKFQKIIIKKRITKKKKLMSPGPPT